MVVILPSTLPYYRYRPMSIFTLHIHHHMSTMTRRLTGLEVPIMLTPGADCSRVQ